MTWREDVRVCCMFFSPSGELFVMGRAIINGAVGGSRRTPRLQWGVCFAARVSGVMWSSARAPKSVWPAGSVSLCCELKASSVAKRLLALELERDLGLVNPWEFGVVPQAQGGALPAGAK